MSNIDETFCTYCQREYGTPQALRRHIEREHPGTHADHNVNKENAS